MIQELRRPLDREIKEHGGDEFVARLELITELHDKRRRIRNTPDRALREAICDALIFSLWEPIIPRVVAIGREWGIEIDEGCLSPPRLP